MITDKHLCGVKQCVYLLEWLIAMGGCWKWWDCHRINYKSLGELVKGGFQFYISISKLELHRHNHLFSKQDIWLFWITIVCHCAEKWSNLLIFEMINLAPTWWSDSLPHEQLLVCYSIVYRRSAGIWHDKSGTVQIARHLQDCRHRKEEIISKRLWQHPPFDCLFNEKRVWC